MKYLLQCILVLEKIDHSNPIMSIFNRIIKSRIEHFLLDHYNADAVDKFGLSAVIIHCQDQQLASDFLEKYLQIDT